MTHSLLKRAAHRPKPGIPVLDGVTLVPARAHEVCGPSRRMLALMAARAMDGPVFWLQPAWGMDRLYAPGVAEVMDPGRLTFVTVRRPEDLLWSMEEVLRAGVVPLVVADLPAPPALTPVRRLHLAAETGGREGTLTPLALLLTPGGGGAQGVESRWHMAPRHGLDGTAETRRWHLERRRSRTAPVAGWTVERHGRRFVTRSDGQLDAAVG